MEPFTIDIPQADLDDLRNRLARTRRIPVVVADDWSRGIPPSVLDRVLAHWGGPYDWRAHETRLNGDDHRTVDVDGLPIHLLRAGTPGAPPLLLLHGWPDGFVRFEKALPLLAGRFEVIVPSIPGFAFSGTPDHALGPVGVADLLAGLMTALGHARFGVHGADIGAQIGEQLALRHPSRLTGLHLGDVPLRRLRALAADDAADLDDDERATLAALVAWETAEGAYARLQRTKPQTIGVALEDSPAGLAAWIVEKFQAWTDGDALEVYSLDELCTNLSIYWLTRSAASAAQYYYDNGHAALTNDPVTVPTGFAMWPKDIVRVPRRTAERWFPVVRFTEMPRGGHFGPWEAPVLWAAEVRAFFDELDARA